MSDQHSSANGTSSRSSRGEVQRLPVQIGHVVIQPPVEDEEGHVRRRPRYLRRIFWLTLLATVLAAIILVAMEDPLGWGVGITLSWQGLMVYSSILALALFLVILLFRYFAVLVMSYLHTAKYTAREETYVRDLTENNDPSTFPPVSIIVPAYNEGKLVERTIGSLLAMDYPVFEIVVVDDGSTDNTNQVASAYVGRYTTVGGGAAEVKLVSRHNGGKATALNAGIHAARFDFILCVDGDSELSPQTLRRAIRHFADPEIGAVAGNVKVKNRKGMWPKLQALEYVEGLNMVRAAQSSMRLVNIIPGPVGLFRREALQAAGYYSPDTFAEDCDLTLKIIRAGWRVVYEPEAIAWTEAPDKLLDLLKQRYRWTRGILQALRKHKALFFNPFEDGKPNFGGTLVLWAMVFESLIWPAMNLFAHVFFVSAALLGYSYYLILWWLTLTLLDFAAAVYCVATEREDPKLVPWVLIYRSFFILTIDVCKVFATVEELLGFGMNWGKLERIGEQPAVG